MATNGLRRQIKQIPPPLKDQKLPRSNNPQFVGVTLKRGGRCEVQSIENRIDGGREVSCGKGDGDAAQMRGERPAYLKEKDKK